MQKQSHIVLLIVGLATHSEVARADAPSPRLPFAQIAPRVLQQPYAPQPYPPQPYVPPTYPPTASPPPYSPEPYPTQPYAPQPYAPQPYPTPPAPPAPYGQPSASPYPTPPYAAPYPVQPYPPPSYPPTMPTPAQPPLIGPRGEESRAVGVGSAGGRRSRRSGRRVPTPPEIDDPDAHDVSLTISLLHPLLVAVYEATVEVRLGRNIGLAAVGGFGSIGLRKLDARLPDQSGKLLEFGGQLRTYPLGSFDHGVQLGLEVIYLHGTASAEGTIDVPDSPGMTYSGTFTASGTGFRIGPFLGYKLVLPVGLTLGAQLGIEYLTVRAIASDSLGHSETGSNRGALPLVDLSAGWSF